MALSSMDLFELFFASSSIHKELNYCVSKQALRLGLSLLELQVLWVLASSDGMTMTEIAMVTAYSKDELKSIVESLEGEGLATRVYQEDSLKCSMVATQEGRNEISKIPVCGGTCPCKYLDLEMVRAFVDQAYFLVGAFRGGEVSPRPIHRASLG